VVDLEWGPMQEQDARRAGPRTLANFGARGASLLVPWSFHSSPTTAVVDRALEGLNRGLSYLKLHPSTPVKPLQWGTPSSSSIPSPSSISTTSNTIVSRASLPTTRMPRQSLLSTSTPNYIPARRRTACN